jgi:hypothetical protein
VAGVDNDLEHPDVNYTLTQYHRHVTRFTLTRARDDSQVHAHDVHVIAHAYTRAQVQEDTHRRACAYTARTRCGIPALSSPFRHRRTRDYHPSASHGAPTLSGHVLTLWIVRPAAESWSDRASFPGNGELWRVKSDSDRPYTCASSTVAGVEKLQFGPTSELYRWSHSLLSSCALLLTERQIEPSLCSSRICNQEDAFGPTQREKISRYRPWPVTTAADV